MTDQTNIIEQFFSNYPNLHLAKGEILVQPEQEPAGIYYIKEGRIRQYTISPNGTIATLHVYHPGSFFPLIWAITNRPNRHFFDATIQTTLIRAPKEAVISFLKNNPDELFTLTNRLLMGLDGLLTRIETLVITDVSGRVISELLYLAKHYGVKKKKGITIGKHTHQEIAEFVGAARETVSIAIEKLVDQGLIKYIKHDIYIPDLNKLAQKRKLD